MDAIQIRAICDHLDIDLNFCGDVEDLSGHEAYQGGYIIKIYGTWACINIGDTVDYLNPRSTAPPCDLIYDWLIENYIDRISCNANEQYKHLECRYTGYYCIAVLWSSQYGIDFKLSDLNRLSRQLSRPYDV